MVFLWLHDLCAPRPHAGRQDGHGDITNPDRAGAHLELGDVRGAICYRNVYTHSKWYGAPLYTPLYNTQRFSLKTSVRYKNENNKYYLITSYKTSNGSRYSLFRSLDSFQGCVIFFWPRKKLRPPAGNLLSSAPFSFKKKKKAYAVPTNNEYDHLIIIYPTALLNSQIWSASRHRIILSNSSFESSSGCKATRKFILKQPLSFLYQRLGCWTLQVMHN